MPTTQHNVDVYLEAGAKRTFAGALDWPGWCRSGRDEASALQALLAYAPRYARVLQSTRLGFQAPRDESVFVVRERLEGNATTDFGAPGMAPSSDARPVDEAERVRLEKLLKACWRGFDQAIEAATGRPLRTGPRGGGRDLESIVEHVLGADASYTSQVGWRISRSDSVDREAQLEQARQAMLQALTASARGEIAPSGPRCGLRWSARYFVRRVAWHTLDHLWEIEDRLLPE
jgi:hypothetical protein